MECWRGVKGYPRSAKRWGILDNEVMQKLVSEAKNYAKKMVVLDALKKQDYPSALTELIPLAEKGDATAQFKLGWMYQRGQGVPKNHKIAAKWFMLAASKGIADAQYILGGLYRRGKGVPKNQEIALKWYKLAAKQGHELAQNRIKKLSTNQKTAPTTTVQKPPAPLLGKKQVFAGTPRPTAFRRPLVVIRFDRKNVPYQQALYNAVSRVLEKRPGAVFDLVAVAPSAGGSARVALNTNKARRQAEEVLRSLIEMGLPPARVAVAAKASATTRTNEVHLYIR